MSRVEGTRTFRRSWILIAASAIGWILLLGLFIVGAILECYISSAFLLIIPATGIVVFINRGGDPPTLRIFRGSEYNRLVVASLHMNETEWLAFYGETTIVNALLNLPLRVNKFPKANHWVFNITLRLLILGQWTLAIGAAATQNWDSYFITFWILFWIFSNAFMFSAKRCCRNWLEKSAGFQLRRFQATLSSRRALLNTIIALNPDTFPFDVATMQESRQSFFPSSLAWIDPILKHGTHQSMWEEATHVAMTTIEIGEERSEEQRTGKGESDMNGTKLSPWWKNYQKYYWCKFISEGITK